MSDVTPPQGSNSGYLAASIIFGLVISIAYCKDQSTSDAVPTTAYAQSDIIPAEKTPVDELSEVAIGAGYQHFKKVAASGVQGGALVYAQNCFAALDKEFAWTVLDRCGAFDQVAVRTLDHDSSYFNETEADYFDAEVVAGRYLSASTKHGLDGEDADIRFGLLQKMTAKLKLASKPVEVAVEPDLDEAMAEIIEDGESQPTTDPTPAKSDLDKLLEDMSVTAK